MTMFHDDMESGLNNWTLEGSDGTGGPAVWTHSQHRFSSAGSALYYGKSDTLDYDTGKRSFGSATSVPTDLTKVRMAQLSFYRSLARGRPYYSGDHSHMRQNASIRSTISLID